MGRRRLAFVRRGYSATGGAEAYLLRLAGALAGEGVELTLHTSPDWPSCQWPHGEIRRIHARSPARFAAEFQRARRADEIVFSFERVPDCAIFRAGDGVHAAWLDRRRAMELPVKTFLRRFNPKHRQLLALERAVFDPARTRVVIANSELVRGEILVHYNFPKDCIRVIRNGIPVTPWSEETRREERSKLGISDAEYVALFVGSGWERKGLRHAVGAAARVPDATLLVAGSGSPRVPHQRVRYLGPVANIPALLVAADVFILPTVYDPCSNACLEATGAGLPVITTASNGAGEVLEEGRTGTVVSAPDAIGELAGALEFWSNPERRAAARRACEATAATHSMRRNAEETLAVIRSLD